MEQATNQFTKGLQCDTHPMVLSNDTLTDCLNGTLITMNGNEVVLLNDMGNRRVDNAFLPPGYEPVGMKEYGGIIYVAAYNPVTNHSQVGSFPSPEKKLSPADEKTNLSAEFDFDTKFYGDKNIEHDDYYGLNFLKNDSFLIPLTGDLNLHVGDKFTVYAAGLSEIKDRITNYDNTIKLFEIVTKSEYDEEKREFKRKIEYYLWKEVEQSKYDEEQDNSKKRLKIIEGEIHYFLKKEVSLSEYNEEQDSNKKEIIYYLCKKSQLWTPKNREFTLQLGILNSQNEFVDITKSLVRWEELNKLESYIKENLIFGNKEDIKIVKINPGDIIITYSNTSNNNFQLEYSVDKENWESIGDLPINIPLNNLYLKGKNVTVETIINKSTKEWEIIDYNNESELFQFNDGYFIPDSFISPNWEETIKDAELIQERQALPANTYAYKLVGPLYLKVTLNHIQSCDYSVDVEKNPEKENEIYLTITSNIKYNCPDGTETSTKYDPIGEYYTKDLNIPTQEFFNLIKDTQDSYKKDSLEYNIETSLIENNVTKICLYDSHFIGFSPGLDALEKVTEAIISYFINNDNIIFNKDYKNFEYELNLENSFITVNIFNTYDNYNYITIYGELYECLKFKITKDKQIFIGNDEENPINLPTSTTLILGGNINSTSLWDDNNYQIVGAADHCREILIDVNNNKITFISSQGELKKVLNYSLIIDTNAEELKSIKLKTSNEEFLELNYSIFSKYEVNNISHYQYFLNLSLLDMLLYSQLVFESTNISESSSQNYGIVRILISPTLNYCYSYISLPENPYNEYLFLFNEIPERELDRIFYSNMYYYDENLKESLLVNKAYCIYISNPYVKFNLSKIYENYKAKVLEPRIDFLNLYKKTGQYFFNHKITLTDIENTKIEFNAYNKVTITSIEIEDNQGIKREIITNPINLFEPQSYIYSYKIPSFKDSDIKVTIIFMSDEYSPNVGIFLSKEINEDIEPYYFEKSNMKYDIVSNLYSLDIINKYKISNLTSNELNYIIGVKTPNLNYYLRGYTTKGNIDLDSFHSDKVEITNWSTHLGSDSNPNAILFKLGIKNYNESKINNIKIKVKEDDGTAIEKPIIIININDISFGLENWITLDLTEDKYYRDNNKIEKNKAYIVQEIKYTLTGSDEEKEIKEVERDLYNYNKIIKTTTGKDKALVRWFITTDLFNNFYSTNIIKDYCIPSTSKIRNIIEFEKILQIENLYISYSPNITLSNELIILEEESSINFDDKCEITHDSFKPYSEYIILSLEYSSSTTHEEVNIVHSLVEEEINYIYKRGLNIYGAWFYLKSIKIETQSHGNIYIYNSLNEDGDYMGSGHTINYFSSAIPINPGDSLKILLYKGTRNSLLKVYTFKDEPYNLEIRKNNISLNYPNIITKWIKDCHELEYMEPYDIILKKLEESEEEVRVSSNKTSYKIKDINAGELKKILTLGDESAYNLININNKDFIEFDKNKVIINLFYISDHLLNINPLKIYTFESILDKYNKSIPSPNSGKEELYITLFPDWHAHVGDDYHYLIIHYSNNPNSSIRGYYDIPTIDYDYLDRNKYFVENDDITTFYYTEDVITDFSNKVNKILSDNNKNYNQIYLNVEGVRLAKNYTESPKATSKYQLRFCKDLNGYWFPSKYEGQANYDETLKATFYLSSITDDSEGIYENYYSDNRYILTGNSETGQLSILFRIPIRLVYVGNYNNTTYSLGSLKFKLKQFNTLLILDSKILNVGTKFDEQIKNEDNSKYILKLVNGREIDLNHFNNKNLISLLNDRDILYCTNYNGVENGLMPLFNKVINLYNNNFQLEYLFEEKETYSEYGYNALYSGSGDEDSATYLNFDGNFVDDRIRTN